MQNICSVMDRERTGMIKYNAFVHWFASFLIDEEQLTSDISIAHMIAPPGWSEPFQTPEFDEFTFVIKGKKQFTIDNEVIVLESGQSIKIEKGTRGVKNEK